IGAAGFLKTRLLFGALRLEPDETRHQGIGQHMARVIESESIESLTLAGGFYAVATGADLVMTAIIFIVISQMLHLTLLLGTIAIATGIASAYLRQCHRWTDSRLRMTHDLIERMVGHRTRLAQEPGSGAHEREDELLADYLVLSSRLDRTNLALAAVPRCWLFVALLGLAPSFVMGSQSPGALAASLGGILLAFGAFGKLTSTFAYLAGSAIAWKQVGPLLAA